jgi:pimeloyl-ACP methyl ester carboxylesterase
MSNEIKLEKNHTSENRKGVLFHSSSMSVNCEEAGHGNLPVIIFVHGAGASSATWTMQLRNLSAKLHVVAVDLNGHGKTPDRQEQDIMTSYLTDIGNTVSRFNRPYLAGHSMGGALTQLYALQNPHKLAGIILAGTGARLRVTPMIFDLLDNDFDAYVDAIGKFAFHTSTSSSLIEASLAEVRKCPIGIIRRDFELCDTFDIMETVENIKTPTLILVGDNDQMTPAKYSAYLHDNIKGSEHHIIENAGHSLMFEQPNVFNQTILNWTRSLS